MNIQNFFEVNSLETITEEYLRLLKYSIKSALKNSLPLNIFFYKYNTSVNFKYNSLKLDTSNTNCKENLEPIELITPYFYIQLPIVFKSQNKIYEKYYNIFKIPKIDLQGNFILNGRKKVLISSFKKFSGIFFKKINNKSKVFSKIILSKFSTIYLELTDEGYILYLGSKKFKLDVIILLHCLGLSTQKILTLSRYGSSLFLKKFVFKSFNFYKNINNFKYILQYIHFIQYIEIYSVLKSIPLVSEEIQFNLTKFYSNTFLIFYKKLIACDLITILDILIDIKLEKHTYCNTENINTKYLQTPGILLKNLVSNLLETTILKNIKIFKETTNFEYNFKQIEQIFKFKHFTSALHEFLTINPLIQYLEQINSLSELMHKIRINSFLSIKPETRAGINIRDIKPSYFGKICLLHTSEGANSGLILSLTSSSKLDKNNQLHTFIENTSLYTIPKFTYLESIDTSIPIDLEKRSLRKNKVFNKYSTIILEKNNFKTTKFSTFSKNISNYSLFSYAENLVPFLYNNDPTRGLMGARMLLQTLPLIYRQKAYLITGKESSIFEHSSNNIRANIESIVSYVSNLKIILRDIFNRQLTYYLKKYKKTNQGNILNQSPSVWPGERVVSGQLIAINYDTIDSEIALGNNLTVLYGGYYGSEHEDALIVNKKLVNKHMFTSLHFEIYENYLCFRNKMFPEYSTILLPKTSLFIRRNLDSFGIIKEGTFCVDKDILISKLFVTELKYSLTSALYFLIHTMFGQNLRSIQNCSLYSKEGVSGRIVKIELFIPKIKKKHIHEYLNIRIFICNQRLLAVGDKITGRHGNKGVIARFVEDINFPYNVKLSPDIIINSLSVPSRMNLGQIFEGIFGMYSILKNSRIILNSEIGYNNTLIKKSFIYLQLNQLNLKYGNVFEYNPYSIGKYVMRDGIYGIKFKNTVFLGNSNFFKLVHMIKEKYHSRTIGLYTEIMQEPVKGRSKGGGQRFGEMEVWAMEAYGASYNLKEILTYKSNDLKCRSSLYKYILGNSELIPTTTTESFRLIVRELNGIAINLNSFVYSNINKSISQLININF